MPPYALEPAAEHAEIRAALHELVGRFLTDYERAAKTYRQIGDETASLRCEGAV